MITKRTLSLKHYKISALEWGKKNPHKILALHGWLDNAGSFLPLATYLKDFHGVAIDLIGHGLSSHRPKGTSYHFIDAVSQVEEVLEALKWQTCTLMGHSMGAGIATLTVPTFPEKFGALVLIEGLGPFSRLPDDGPSFLRKHLEGTKALLSKKMPRYKKKEDAALARKAAGDLSLEASRLLCERGLKKVGSHWTWRADPRLRVESPMRMSEEQTLAYIKRIACPTLLLRALNGLNFDPAIMGHRRSLIKNQQYLEVPGGHHFHMETPEKTAELIVDFLKNLA